MTTRRKGTLLRKHSADTSVSSLGEALRRAADGEDDVDDVEETPIELIDVLTQVLGDAGQAVAVVKCWYKLPPGIPIVRGSERDDN